MFIGKGGSKISDLQFESGAVIKVTKDTEGDDTKIIIIGGKEETKKAEELIMDLTVERSQFSRPSYEFNAVSAPEKEKISDDIASFDWRSLSTTCVCILTYKYWFITVIIIIYFRIKLKRMP